MRGYIRECILGPLLKLGEATLELIVPLVMAKIIDVGIGNGDSSYAVKMSIVLAVLGIAGLLLSVTAQYFAAKASVGFVTKIRAVLFRHIQGFSYSELDEVGASTLITRMTSDINQLQNGTNLTLRLFLRSPFVVFGAMVMAFTVDFKSALVFAGVIPILSVVVFGIMLASIPLYRRVQRGLDSVLEKTRENLTGVRVIRAFCKEQEEIDEFNRRNDELTGIQQYVGGISALMNPLTYVIINLAVVVLIKIGAVRVNSGFITQGAVVALYNYMSQILVELIKLANLIINITKSVACGNRIQEILETPPAEDKAETSAETSSSEYAVEFDDVYLRYGKNSDYSLSGISFAAKRGETIGIIGGTGSGKTSVVNLIPKLYTCERGTVRVNGIDVAAQSEKELRAKIGIVPQKAVLFKGSIRQNIQWGKPEATDEEIYAALEIAQAADFVAAKEGGLDYMIEQGGKNLSGGQRQRLTIARAVVKKPEILILDDSASALDFATDAALRRAIKGMNGQTTVFIVSQRASSIRYADKIIVLEDGEAVGIGTHEELIENCEIYKEIHSSQSS